MILVSGDSGNLMIFVILVIDRRDKTNRRERYTPKPHGYGDPHSEFSESGDSCETGNSG